MSAVEPLAELVRHSARFTPEVRMKASARVPSAWVLAALVLLAVAIPPSPAAERPRRYVVLISVDGLAASYFNDPRAHLPMLRKLARQGAVAEGMITSFPSVTWPSHTSLVTGVAPGKHGILGNSTLDRKTAKSIVYIGDPVFTKDQCVKAPAIYDAASKAGLTCGAVIWPACNGAKTLKWVIPDSNRPAIHQKYTTPGLAAELDHAGISIRQLGRWGWNKEYSAPRDALYARVTSYLLKKHRPNLMLLHLITPDAVEHAYGPHVDEAYWAVNDSDNRVRDVWETLQTPPLKGRSTLIVVSDHGFAPYDKFIDPNVAFRKAGLIAVDKAGRITRRQVWSHSSGGAAQVYVLDEKNRAAVTKKARAILGRIEGVENVLGPAEFMKYGLPDPKTNPEQADLMLSAKPGYTFSNGYRGETPIRSAGGRKGTHGQLPDRSYMHATFLAVGAGIKPGVKLKTISNLDVTPTIAKLLGIEFPTADGRVLTEVLAK
jgi:predicted AlkP superfamily pyrophosphatase or phosphodiesterase